MLVTRITSIDQKNSLEEAISTRSNSKIEFKTAEDHNIGSFHHFNITYDLGLYFCSLFPGKNFSNKEELISKSKEAMTELGWKREDERVELNLDENIFEEREDSFLNEKSVEEKYDEYTRQISEEYTTWDLPDLDEVRKFLLENGYKEDDELLEDLKEKYQEALENERAAGENL